jgi:hypothetical protein
MVLLFNLISIHEGMKMSQQRFEIKGALGGGYKYKISRINGIFYAPIRMRTSAVRRAHPNL